MLSICTGKDKFMWNIMKKYIKYIELGFQDGLYYRTSNIMTFLSSFFIDYIKVMIWYAAVAFASRRVSSELINSTLLYMIIAAAVSSIYRTQPTMTLSEAYLRGNLIHRRVYPVSILVSNFCEMRNNQCFPNFDYPWMGF